MDQATHQLVQYARYHRDPRNIATHFIGVPLIVFAVAALLARAQFDIGELTVGANWVLWAVAVGWYLKQGQRSLALITALVLAVLVALADPLGTAPLNAWLAWSLGIFTIGWAFQFVGHFWEGRKPAFMDDLRGLLIGPLFVMAELAFALGTCRALRADIEAAAGPVQRHTPTDQRPV